MRTSDVPEHAPVVVVSPHLDDGGFGCGQLLSPPPGSVVITVFTERPAEHKELTSWDASAGFQSADAVMPARRAEDRAALALLGARPVWLGFVEDQYGPLPAVDTVAYGRDEAIRATAL